MSSPAALLVEELIDRVVVRLTTAVFHARREAYPVIDDLAPAMAAFLERRKQS